MKKVILNFGAILTAFIIGLAINSACADSLDKMSDTELRNLISQLQQEVNALKSRVAELEGKVNASTSGSGSSFEVDGLHFSRSGNCENPIDYYENNSSYTIINGEKTMTEGGYKISYAYDSYGRVSKTTQESSSYLIEYNYTYSGKTSVCTYKTTYKNPSSTGGQSESGYTITYHYR